MSVFVSLSVKAVHWELVTDLTSDAFISCLRRFIARRGYPSLLWSDHGSNFTGANREMKELIDCLKNKRTRKKYQNSALSITLNGSSLHSTLLILVGFGRL